MHAGLERLVRLQDLDIATSSATREIAETPARRRALEARLTEHETRVTEGRARLAENQAGRRETERSLATVQARLAHFKDQLMSVKTNREYLAMQTEMAAAEQEIRTFEDTLLEGMLKADEFEQAIDQAEQALAAERARVAEEQAELEQAQRGLETEVERAARERRALVAEIEPNLLALFESIATGRGGIALTEARDGHCSVCHVRLRPQIYNEVLKNDAIHRCENCQRILYFVPAAAGSRSSPT